MLKIGRKKVSSIVDQLVKSRKKGKQRVSGLDSCRELIKECVSKEMPLTCIREKLPGDLKNIHRSTLWRYIQKYCRGSSQSHFIDLPGTVAYVSFIRICDTDNIFLFSLIMGYSKYGYFSPSRHAHLYAFLHCHVQCFQHLGGVPRCIRLCEVSCLHLSNKDCTYYCRFLKHHGSRFETGRQYENINLCNEQLQIIKEQILSQFFHPDFKALVRSIRHVHLPAYNQTVLPGMGRSIAKEFRQCEQKELLPIPPKPFPIPVISSRKVNARGQVYYHGHYYQLSDAYTGKQITIIHTDLKIIISFQDKHILQCPYN